MSKKPVALLIMDGFGENPSDYGNAIAAANTPNLDKLMAECPTTMIGASGLDVGLPDGQMGNSEVGHTNIGAGRVVYQELVRITKSFEDGDALKNEAFLRAVENCKQNDSALHLMGLLSNGGVHSHQEHLYGLLQMAKKMGLTKVYVHAFLDGRDVPPSSGADFMKELVAKMGEIGVGKVASVMGRFYAMDRDNAWDRVGKAYAAMVYGEGNSASCPVKAIEGSYQEGVTDEFVVPVVIEGTERIKANDSVIFFNFRPDRARQITRSFVDPDFKGFERKNGCFPLTFVCMTQYDATMPNVLVAYSPKELTMTFGEYISQKGLTQLRIAETQKYAHVTFFFNGGEEKTFPGEDRILVPSPNVETFDQKPEMSAYEVTDKVVEAINDDKYDVIILNWANCDMVGHTGIMEAAKAAVEAVDTCVGRTVDAILKKGGAALITADHGNAEKMCEPDGSPFTAHTTNPVPLILAGCDCKLREGGRLADLAPTMLQILGLPKPEEMDGESLIQK
ncbi:2,3-bisphosphoglycerate-independent phosphoglycerate mutase [Fumia xinanensis]|uniref:2,3-bisphosphoglycerate-independent phosphoglycerate mutase n=1 Tax=Fumia xinanensis TaxID=2763659 RepID=A0A926I881_9FIRM|nr:2,3-bisphosphoglycerate-independent phosphoglycerate mutase [Fumia xinanensis]MBC8560686.1 2,3-bisphosphoglycerate-independent phosphoglycerate mutase [Fumia xinanensis]